MQDEPEPPAPLAITPEAALAGPTPAVRVESALAAFLNISTAIYSSRSLDELATGVLEPLFDAVPAARGAILMFERWTSEPVSVHCWNRGSGAEAEVSVCRDFVTRAYREAAAVLTNDAVGEGGERGLSKLAVPLFGRDKLVGVIYLEAPGADVQFEADHLQFVTAIGVVAGAAIENARYTEWLRAENERLHDQIGFDHGIVGESSRMREVLQFVSKVAPADSTVLIHGESGTGKELVARAIHGSSPRASKPFVAINCAALTESLLESELFGHERGAFTGAIAQKKGKIELASGGTLFLDEVGELPLTLQAKLLRVLQERQFDRVGGTRPIHVDIRLLAATNRDLRAASVNGSFRPDLFYRLNVVSIEVPALRERREDIPVLANHFALKHGMRMKRNIAGVSPEAGACLLAYDWPGNVRELENAIERGVVLGSTELILPEDLPDSVLDASPAPADAPESYHEAVKREKKEQILRAIEKAGGSFTDAAKILGIHPNYLHRLIRNLNLREAVRRAVNGA